MRSKFARKQGHTGEYPTVLHNVKDSERLVGLHRTPCTPNTALLIIQKCKQNFSLIFLEKISISQQHRRGRAGSRVIMLPDKPLLSSDSNVIGKLRIGLVLHELAHVVHQTKFRQRLETDRKSHGKAYCKYLDELIEWYIQVFTEQYERIAAEIDRNRKVGLS